MLNLRTLVCFTILLLTIAITACAPAAAQTITPTHSAHRCRTANNRPHRRTTHRSANEYS